MIIVTVAKKTSKKGITDCVLSNGCGALNINATRVATPDGKPAYSYPNGAGGVYSHKYQQSSQIAEEWNFTTTEDNIPIEGNSLGRWPTNLFLNTVSRTKMDTQSGVSKSSGGRIGNAEGTYSKLGKTGFGTGHTKGDPGFGDVGGASRYFKVF